jgi:hypothetical protein
MFVLFFYNNEHTKNNTNAKYVKVCNATPVWNYSFT